MDHLKQARLELIDAAESYEEGHAQRGDESIRYAQVNALIAIAESLAKLAELSEKRYRDEHIHDRIML